jgi:hypothetical protein
MLVLPNLGNEERVWTSLSIGITPIQNVMKT